jgi:hypothetical protein
MPKMPEADFPQTPEEARLCVHGNQVWFGHECGLCDSEGEYRWADEVRFFAGQCCLNITIKTEGKHTKPQEDTLETVCPLCGKEVSLHKEEPVQVTLLIDNYYEGGDKIKTTYEGWIPAPPGRDDPGYEDWEQDWIYEYTGTGRTEGDSAYFVTVGASSRPDLLPVGTEFEFGT